MGQRYPADAAALAVREGMVRRAIGGSGEAFTELYRDLAPRVRRAAYRRTHDMHEAEDAVQDAFLDAFRCLRDLGDARSFEAWLLRITRNRAIDRARDLAKCRPSLRAQDDELDTARGMPRVLLRTGSGAPQPDQIVMLRSTLGEMSAPLRAALSMRYEQGLACGEIARIEGVTVAAVKTRLHRARLALRSALTAARGHRPCPQGRRRAEKT